MSSDHPQSPHDSSQSAKVVPLRPAAVFPPRLKVPRAAVLPVAEQLNAAGTFARCLTWTERGELENVAAAYERAAKRLRAALTANTRMPRGFPLAELTGFARVHTLLGATLLRNAASVGALSFIEPVSLPPEAIDQLAGELMHLATAAVRARGSLGES